MTRLLANWLGHKLSKWGQTNPNIYRWIMIPLVGVNAILLDPQVTDMVNNEFGDNPWVTRSFHFISLFIMAVMGPDTKKKDDNPQGATSPATTAKPDRKRKKFVFF
jgi:hypothetical protein